MDASSERALPLRSGLPLATRLVLLALLLVAEKVLLTHFVDTKTALHSQGIEQVVRIAQYMTVRLMVTFIAALALFAYIRTDRRLTEANAAARAEELSWRWLALNVALMAPLSVLSYSLYGHHGLALPFAVTTALWIAGALVAVLAAARAMAPWAMWQRAAAALGSLWLYAGIAAVAAVALLHFSQLLWDGAGSATFALVARLLQPFIPSLSADTANHVLTSDTFSVHVSDACSGLEGLSLVLAFCIVWLVYLRNEYIWPRALVLIPLGMLVSYALNVVRIAALMLIGNAGYQDVAVYGFHTEAGWIAFNLVACGIAFVSRRSPWLNRTASNAHEASGSTNPTAAYLAPFLCILAAGIIAKAGSAGFERLYYLRPLAAIVALIAYRQTYRSLNWRCSWRGLLAGLAVFVVWIVGARWLLHPSAMPPELTAMSSASRALWIAVRAAAAVGTVPIAEELAFRGFLMRRITSADFESVPFRSVRVTAWLVSALIFGSLHGALWPLAMIAGVVYALVAIRTNSLGESVAAHATTNALVALCVLAFGAWQLW